MRREKRSSRRKPGTSSSSGPPSTSTPGAPSSSGLIEDGEGLTFQHLGRAEAEFLYQEIFVRRAYFQSGVSLPATGQPTVVDVGANIGLFSLACHRANPRCRLVAVEPAPAAFAVLERNLSHVPGATCVRQALADSTAARGELTVYPGATAESSRHPRERAMQRARLQAPVANPHPDPHPEPDPEPDPHPNLAGARRFDRRRRCRRPCRLRLRLRLRR